MAGVDYRTVNMPKLQDDSYGWFLQSYIQQQATFRQWVTPFESPDFKPENDWHREVVGLQDIRFNRRADGGQVIYDSGAEEDFYWQMKVEPYTAAMQVPPNMVRLGLANMVNWIQGYVRGAAIEAERIKNQHAYKLLLRGCITAGDKTYFNHTVPGFADPYPGKIYDNVSWFNASHPQSKSVSGTTHGNNIIETLAFNRANIKTARIRMSITNAYDRLGKEITISPNAIIAPDTMRDTIKRELTAVVEDADQQPNVISDYGYKTITDRVLDATDTDCWFLMELVNGANPDVVFKDNWRPIEVNITYDPINHLVWYVNITITYAFGIRDFRHSLACNIASS